MAGRRYSAWELAKFADCSLAELSYWQEIGLLMSRPSAPDGEPCYDDVDLLRLQQIRIGRARGLALEEIRRWLATCAREESRDEIPPVEVSVSAPPFRALYLETEVKAVTPTDRAAFQLEAAELYRALAARQRSGAAPLDPPLRHWVERHRCHISRWFCPCDAQAHGAFARAIVNNPQLSASIERHGRDLSSFLLSVIEAHTR